jgi:hypothetical protein
MTSAKATFSSWLAITNLVVLFSALVIYSFPNLIILGFFLFILPGFLMGLLPSAALYLTLFSIGWFALQRAHWGLGIVAGLAAMSAFGLWLPDTLNRQTAEALDAIPGNRELERPISPVRNVALQASPAHWSRACNDLCQVLLFNGEVDRVVILPPTEPLPESRKPAPRLPFVYRIEKSSSCLQSKDSRVSSSTRWLPALDAGKVERATLTRVAAGECLIGTELPDAQADLTVRWVDKRENRASTSRLRLVPKPVTIVGLELLDPSGRVLARKLQRTPAYYRAPLLLEPIGSGGGTLGFLGWEWSKTTTYSEPFPIADMLERWTSFDLDPPHGASDSALRVQIDQMLDDPSMPATHAAFALLGPYFGDLRSESLLPSDSDRLARLIRDPRVTQFNRLPASLFKNKEFAPKFKGAMLDRLQTLGPQNRRLYESLERFAAELPPGAFASRDPRVDTLLANPETRGLSPNLIWRQIDRGLGAAPLFLQYLREAWSPQYRSSDQGKVAQASMRGLCRLGRSASPYLPQLQQMARDGLVSRHIQDDLPWRAMLVSLGMDAASFQSPYKRKKQEEYTRQLNDYVKRQCAT